MKRKYVLNCLIIIFLLFSISSCRKDKDNGKRIYLNDNWLYSLDGEPYPFYEMSVEDLPNLSSFLENRIGYIYIKTTFTLPNTLKYKDLSLNIGRIKIATKIYINNRSIGKTGSFPPREFTEGNKTFSLEIPKEYLNLDGINTLSICLWCHGYGSIETTPFISESYDSEIFADYNTLIYSKIYLVFTIILLIISLIYFFLFLLRRSETENLTFSLLCLFTGIYLSVFYYGEYSFLGKGYLSYLDFEKIFKGATAIITGYLIVCFTRDFMHYPEKIRFRVLRFFITVAAIILPCTAGNIPDFRSRLRIGFIFIILQFFFEGKIIYTAYKKKDKRLVHFVICLIPFMLAFTSQLIAKLIFQQKIDTLLLAISWIAVIFMYLGILIMHFVQLANEVEYMNKNLEDLVTVRTEDLEKEKNRALKEIDLAGFVQKSFYKTDTSELQDFEFELVFKPMAGVSGDLYISIISDNRLQGFGIFDISGHGIASGLVTMLVKNIIEQEFKKGADLPLNEVMSKINERIIVEKGSIENYLTGMLIRFNKDGYELVNAGHPKAILYNSETKQIQTIEQEGVNQFGAIGIADFPISFEIVNFTMNPGDELLLYTDGISECTNPEKEYFGANGILQVFKDNIDKELKKQVDALPEALFKFTCSEELNDDITYIILKKK